MANGLKQDISIGDQLQWLRRQQGLTQGQVAAQLETMGIPMTGDIIAKIEQGKYSVKISVLLALKQVYRVESFDVFFQGLSLPE